MTAAPSSTFVDGQGNLDVIVDLRGLRGLDRYDIDAMVAALWLIALGASDVQPATLSRRANQIGPGGRWLWLARRRSRQPGTVVEWVLRRRRGVTVTGDKASQ